MTEPKTRQRRKRGGIAMNNRPGQPPQAVYNVPKALRRDPNVRESYTATGATEAEANLLAKLRDAGRNVPAPEPLTSAHEEEVRTWLGPDGKDLKGTRAAKPNAQKGTTLNEWAEEWLSTWLGGVQDSTRDVYTGNLRRYILPFIGNRRLDDLSAKVLKAEWWDPVTALRKEVRGVPTDKPQLGDSARGNVYKTLRLVLTTAHYKLGTRVSLTEKLIVKPEGHRPETDRQVKAAAKVLREKFIDNPDKDNPHWSLFALSLIGLRQSERLGIRVQDIDTDDPDDPVLLIHQQLDFRKDKGGWYLKDTTKNGEPRSVPLWGAFREAVERQLEWRAKWKAEAGDDWQPPKGCEDLLFLQPGGKLWTRRQDTPAWKEFVGQDMRGYLARHVTGYMLAEDGISMETAKLLLGHKSDAWATYYRIASTRQAHSELTRADRARRNPRVINYPGAGRRRA